MSDVGWRAALGWFLVGVAIAVALIWLGYGW